MAINDPSKEGLGKQNSWPVRYRVVIQDRAENQYRYTATTWFNEAKAIALAVRQHLQHFSSSSDARGHVYDLLVESLGRVQTSSDGKVDVNSSDLTDRLEW